MRRSFLEGLGRALEHYGIPLVGGHTSDEGDSPLVAVSIAGFAPKLMKGSGATPGDRLLVVQDMNGRRHGGLHIWDTVTTVEGARTKAMLEPLVEIAGHELATACRDISNAGLVGTIAMMMEGSGAGARVTLEDIPVPDGVGLGWWLKAYPSYGFILSVLPDKLGEAQELLISSGATCAVIGDVLKGSEVSLKMGDETDVFLDWRASPVTGLF